MSEDFEVKEPDPESDPDDDELDEDYTVSEGFDGTDGDYSEDEPSAAILTILSVLSSFEDHLKGPLGGKRKQKTIHGWITSFRRFLVKHQMKIQGKSISFIATMPVTKYVEGLGKISAKVQFSEALKEFTTMASIQEGTESTLQTLKASRLKAKLMLKTSRRMKHQETKMKAKSVEELESDGQWLDFRKLKEMTCNNPDVAQDWLEYVEESKINWDHMTTRIKSRGLDILMGSVFLRSKAIRPESLMVLPKSAWTNSHVSGLNNVLHSQTFKTEGVYGYTTLVLDKIMSSMINQYLLVVRPLITESTGSTSSNLFLNSVGKPFKQLTYELVRFTERYAGVSITPTRLRMIYETFINEHGSQEQKAAAALSLAHSPAIVKKHYLKRRADEAALKDFQMYSLIDTNIIPGSGSGPQTPVIVLKDINMKSSSESALFSSTPSTVTATLGGSESSVFTPKVAVQNLPFTASDPDSVLRLVDPVPSVLGSRSTPPGPPVDLPQSPGPFSASVHDECESQSPTVPVCQTTAPVSHDPPRSSPVLASPGLSHVVNTESPTPPTAPVTVDPASHIHNSKKIKKSGAGRGRWGDNVWLWNKHQDAYILKKVSLEGTSFKKIHLDGVSDNVWTKECSSNKIKSRYHNYLMVQKFQL